MRILLIIVIVIIAIALLYYFLVYKKVPTTDETVVLEPSVSCDPQKLGYDENGNPNPDCNSPLIITGNNTTDEDVLDRGIECAKKILYKDPTFTIPVGFPRNDQSILIGQGLVPDRKAMADKILDSLKVKYITNNVAGGAGGGSIYNPDRTLIKQRGIGLNICYVILRYLFENVCPQLITRPGAAHLCVDAQTQAILGRG